MLRREPTRIELKSDDFAEFEQIQRERLAASQTAAVAATIVHSHKRAADTNKLGSRAIAASRIGHNPNPSQS